MRNALKFVFTLAAAMAVAGGLTAFDGMDGDAGVVLGGAYGIVGGYAVVIIGIAKDWFPWLR